MAEENNTWLHEDRAGDSLRVTPDDGFWWWITYDDTDTVQQSVMIPDAKVRELRDWLTAKLEGKIEISRRSELKKVEGGQNKLTHILYSDGSADCETEFIPTKLEGKDERTRN